MAATNHGQSPTHLAVSLQLVLQPLEITVPSPHGGVLQLEDRKVGLETETRIMNLHIWVLLELV